MINKKSLLIFSLILCLTTLVFHQINAQNNTIIVSGKNYAFTIETPINWVNDTILAKNFRLNCFFYPASDNSSELNSYMYPLGINKLKSDETLKDFLEKDSVAFRLKHPNFKIQTTPLKNKAGIINSLRFTYSNLEERYKEEVVYNETDSAFIIIAFSAIDQNDYDRYLSVFDSLLCSFEFKGSIPSIK